MAEAVKDNWQLFELMPVAACLLGRRTLRHMVVGAARHRTAGAIG
jgi:hypothetical protein